VLVSAGIYAVNREPGKRSRSAQKPPAGNR